MIRTQGFMVAPTSQAELPSSQGIAATWEGTTGPIRWVRDIGELGDAWQSGRMDGALGRGKMLAPKDAERWASERGMQGLFKFDRPYARQELEILERRKRAELRRQSILSRAEGGGAARFGVSLAASMVDPLNIASAFVPVVGEARYARMLQAAVGASGRAGVRAGVGAVEGLAGAAMLEPLNYAARAQEQADWRVSDSMTNVLFGGAFGSVLHTGGGALADLVTRRRGMVVADAPEEALAPGGSRLGSMSQVRVGDRYAPVQWAIMDASELAPTLDKADNQYRDRNRAAAQAQVREIANDLDFNQLGESPLMDYGAPTLAKDLSAVGGNGRLAAIRMAYDTGRADLYREGLIDTARKYGMSPEDVKAMAKPVLVRLLREDVDVKKAAMASNEGGAMRMSALEQAKVDAERLGNLDAFHVNEDGNLSLARSRDGIRKWVDEQPATQRAALLSSDGMLSAEGAKRLQNAMLFRAYGDSPTLARLVEATDPGSRNVAAAMVRAAPRMAELRAAAAAGERFDLDISPDLQAAVEYLARVREKGQDVAEALAQGDMLGDGLTPEARLLVAFLGRNIRSSRAMADLLARYMDAVDALGSPKQAGLFGEVVPPSKATLLRQAAENYEPSAAELVESAPLELQRAAMQAGIAQAVQGEAINVEPIIKQDAQGVMDMGRRADDPEGKPLNDPQAAQATDEAVADIPAGDDAAQLAAAEKEIAEAEVLLADMVADLQTSGDIKATPKIPELEGLSPEAERIYMEGRATAEANKPEFDSALDGIAKFVGGESVKPPLKSHKAAGEKIRTELGGDASRIKDVLRGTVMVDSIAQARDALHALRSMFDIVGEPRETLLAGKSSGGDGYRDIKVNVRVGNIVAEIQINAKAMIAAKDGLDFKGGPGHRLYEKIREITRKAESEKRDLTDAELQEYRALRSQSKELYDQAFEEASGAADPRVAADNAANLEADTLVPFRSTEANGNLRGGDVSKASANARSSSALTGTPSTSKKVALPMTDILAQLPDDLRAESIAAESSVQNADRMAEIARRASLCALRKGA